MNKWKSIKWPMIVLIMVIITFLSPSRAFADGGPILSDPELWALIDEGQQIAVVTLGEGHQVQVDLFISLLDRSGEAHEIVFFLPLSENPFDFHVEEVNSLDFDQGITQELDEILHEEFARAAFYQSNILFSLLPGTMLMNGSLSWPFLIWWGSSSCAPQAVAPLSSYQTESSQIDIYDVNEKTDLQTLIETTGLDPAVRETLEQYQGQQIAVINFLTQLPSDGEGGRGETGQPGIHLSWKSHLVSNAQGTTYAYPLGTGSAWANPIELTRVYVVAPPGIDFRLQYPKLGEDLSGYEDSFYGGYGPRILEAEDLSYAVENAVGDFGRIWRVTYMFSNASENLVITRLPEVSSETLSALQLRNFQMRWVNITWVISLFVGLGVWLVVWRYAMPRLVGVKYRWQSARLYCDAIGWAFLYPISNGIIALIISAYIYVFSYLFDIFVLTESIINFLFMVIMLISLLGGINILFFARWGFRNLDIPKAQAVKAYLCQAFIANVIYLFFVVFYSALVKAL